MIADQIVHVLAALAFGWCVLAALRWIRGRSEVVGTIVTVAVLGRIGFGLALFWISYLQLPIARSLQVPGGFWLPALDATGYYQMAARAVDAARLYSLDHAIPAPFFVDTLALWMAAVGVSPAAGMFLNLCLYVALVLLLVCVFAPANDWRCDLPLIAGVAAYSFSPVIVIHSTQPLKDELSSLLLAIACLGTVALTMWIQASATRHRWRLLVAATVATGVATLGTAGIRFYLGAIMCGSIGVMLAFCLVRTRRDLLLRSITGSLCVLLAAWLGMKVGAGPYYRLFAANFNTRYIAALPADLITMTQMSRTGFLMSGGGTNIVVPLRADPSAGEAQAKRALEAQHASAAYQEALAKAGTRSTAAPAATASAASRAAPATSSAPSTGSRATTLAGEQAEAARAIPVTAGDQVKTMAIGLAIVFVPISVVQAMTGVDIEGGRGLLSIADLDTLYLDATIVFFLALLWHRRHQIRDRLPVLVFAVVLSGATAVLLGYVVTNFGTLWRMRPLVTVPLWVMAIAVCPGVRSCERTAEATVPEAPRLLERSVE